MKNLLYALGLCSNGPYSTDMRRYSDTRAAGTGSKEIPKSFKTPGNTRENGSMKIATFE